MFETLKNLMHPLTLSRALDVVHNIVGKNGEDPHWFHVPVEDLVRLVGDKPVGEVTAADLRRWYEWVKNRPSRKDPSKRLSPWTVDHYGRALKSFFSHLHAVGHIEDNPACHLHLPSLPEKSKKEIGAGDIEKMVAKSRFDVRDHAIVLILRDSGVRVSGLVSMRISGVHVEENGEGKLAGRAFVESKGYKSRWIFFGDAACRAVQLYIESRPHDAPDELWLSKRGGTPLTTSGIYQLLHRVADRAGVDRWNPHAFRHALAKRLLEEGANPEMVRRILGHKDVHTTLSMYVTYDEVELQEKYAAYLD